MAAFDIVRAQFPTATLNGHIGQNFMASVLGRFSAWNDARQTRNALGKLSARELADIGISVSDIDTVSRTARRF